MQRSVAYSFLLHLGFITLIYIGLPSFMGKTEYQEQVFTVELLPVSEFTNVQPRKVQPTPKPKLKEKAKIISANTPQKSLPNPIRKPVLEKELPPVPKPIVKQKPKTPPQTAEVKPTIKPKPLAEKEKQPSEPPKEEEPKDLFASVLKSVEELKIEEEQKKPDEKEQNFDEVETFLSSLEDEKKYKPGLPMTMSEKDAIRNQIRRNWSVVSGAKGAKDMMVTLKITLSRDGSVRNVKHVNSIRYHKDPFFRATVDSAIRAVYKTSPFRGLPPEKYDVKEGWRELVLNFDPSDMYY